MHHHRIPAVIPLAALLLTLAVALTTVVPVVASQNADAIGIVPR